MKQYKYNIESADLGESDNYCPRWACKELSTYGDTLEELIDNAAYFFIDQDGGELDDSPADDNEAVEYIVKWFEKNCASITQDETQYLRFKCSTTGGPK